MYIYENLELEILEIEIDSTFVTLFFRDGSKCEITTKYSSSCSERLSCYPNGCRISISAFNMFWEKVILKYVRKEKFCTLVPDWISKITKNGRGWEEFQ
jgi:hypothetical protein